ncbi:MAG: outer membrane lipoprotein carrier protein LolA [Deltaproteobacteria bacterium]|nr:outer membrane lipoprotein carrier protein LolA [Deltaproteobacteria bacterium]
MRVIVFTLIHGLLIAGLATPPKHKANFNDFLAAVEKDWDSKQTIEAAYTQTIYSKRLGNRDITKGKILIKKPNKLRWECHTDSTLEIINGKKFIHAKPNKRRGTVAVDIYKDISKRTDMSLLGFLSSKGEFKKHYNIQPVSENSQSVTFKLIPKGTSSEPLVAQIAKESYVLLSLTTDTVDSSSRIDFTDTKANGPLNDKLFEYEPQKNDVVRYM